MECQDLDLKDKIKCLREFGELKRDMSFCDEIKKESKSTVLDYGNCAYGIAIAKNDDSLCKYARSAYGGTDLNENSCLNSLDKLDGATVADCDIHGEGFAKANCLKNTGIGLGDKSICEQVDSQYFSYTITILEVSEKDLCFYNVALNKNDKSICSKISLTKLKDWCLS